MSHYEQRLEQDLNQIRKQMAEVAKRVEAGLKDAMHALLSGNHKLAYATILGDLPINRRVRQIDQLCHSFIALHLPSAGHLRFISSVIRINIELERIGDYAVTICRESVQMSHPPQGILADKLELISEESRHMLSLAIKAFKEGNADTAKTTKGMAAQIDHAFSTSFSDLASDESGFSLTDVMRLFNIFHRLERVAAQAKNICEETIFAATGETKAPKVYHILFLDEDNSGLSQMAETIAQRNFPNSGHYTSAGRHAGSKLNPMVTEFMQGRGFDLSEAQPKTLDMTTAELHKLHVIISLQGAVKNYIPEIPFHTVAMDWDVGELPTGLHPEQTNQQFEAIYRELAVRIQDLMQTLRGTGAS